MSGIGVYVVCEFEPLRVGLCQVLSEAEDLALLGSAASLAEARRQAGSLANATFVVESAHLAEMALADSRGLNSFSRAVFVGAIPQDQDPASVVEHHLHHREAVGFLFEIGGSSRLLETIRLVASGAFVCEMTLTARLRAESTQTDIHDRLSAAMLSRRELEVLACVARGLANKQIALQLHLAEGTVKAHVSHILAKLGVHQRVELVRYGMVLDAGEFLATA